MSRRRKGDDGVIAFAFILGGAVFLLMVHPVIFWVIVIPLVSMGIIRLLAWLKK